MSTNLKKLKQHIKSLLVRYKIDHIPIPEGDSLQIKGTFADRRAFFPHVANDLLYLVALHEIGHFAIVSRRGLLLDEAAVWMWCRDVALIWPLEFDQLVAGCIESYCENIDKSDRVNEITKVVMRS